MTIFPRTYAGMSKACLNADSAEYMFFNKAVGFLKSNHTDSALFYFKLQIRVSPNANRDQRIRSAIAYNRIGVIYTNRGDYRTAYRNLIDGMVLCEDNNLEQELSRILTSIGNIYYYFGKYDIAKDYYLRALKMCRDNSIIDGYYNNAGIALAEIGQMDSARYFLRKAVNIGRHSDNDRLSPIYNSLATFYRVNNLQDSASHYYELSLQCARRNRQVRYEIQNLSDLGSFYLERNDIGRALTCLSASDSLAVKHKMLKFMVSNLFIRANIEEARGNTKAAFENLRNYVTLDDSISSAAIFGDINLVQRMYENAKTDRQIEDLVVKQQAREIIIYISFGFIILVTTGLLYIWRQKKSLYAAYNMLLDKNVEIINLKDHKIAESSGGMQQCDDSINDKHLDSADKSRDALFAKIEKAMADKTLICDPDFSVNKLAAHINSNHTYVSQTLVAATGKNFRAYLNEHRIREAQRIFASVEGSKYTIESVALNVGFKSRTTFYNAFKEFVGVTPNFYLKSMQKRLNK